MVTLVMVSYCQLSKFFTDYNHATILSLDLRAYNADIDECSTGAENCTHNCHNNGNCRGFHCTCNTGYRLDSNRRSCSGQWMMCVKVKIGHYLNLWFLSQTLTSAQVLMEDVLRPVITQEAVTTVHVAQGTH